MTSKTVYEEYDIWKMDGGSSVESFIRPLLVQNGFTGGQADILAEIIDSYVNDASEKLQKVMEDSSPEIAARDVWEAATKEISEDVADCPDTSAEEKKTILVRMWSRIVSSLWGRHQRVLDKVVQGETGDIETPGRMHDEAHRLLLKEISSEEIKKAFSEMTFDPNPEIGLAEYAHDVTYSQIVLESGLLAKQFLDSLESPEDEHDKIAACIFSGLDTDILSPEENTLKKLLALDFLLYAVQAQNDPSKSNREEAPFTALAAAQRAFTDISTVKSTIKVHRISAVVSSLPVLDLSQPEEAHHG